MGFSYKKRFEEINVIDFKNISKKFIETFKNVWESDNSYTIKFYSKIPEHRSRFLDFCLDNNDLLNCKRESLLNELNDIDSINIEELNKNFKYCTFCEIELHANNFEKSYINARGLIEFKGWHKNKFTIFVEPKKAFYDYRNEFPVMDKFVWIYKENDERGNADA